MDAQLHAGGPAMTCLCYRICVCTDRVNPIDGDGIALGWRHEYAPMMRLLLIMRSHSARVSSAEYVLAG